MKQTEFDKKQTYLLRKLKDLRLDELKDIDISHLMFNVSGEALNDTKLGSIKVFFRILLLNVISIKHISNHKDLPLIISYNYHRNDHSNYWKYFKSIVKVYDEIQIEEGRKNYCKFRSPQEIFLVLYNYLKIKSKLKGIGDSVFRRVIASNTSEMIMLKKHIERLGIENKAAFIFFDGGKIENLIVQVLRNCGIVVATMQHGQPVFHGLDCDRINQTMILNFTSDYIMVTGEFSKKQFELGGIPTNKIFVGGSLRKIKPIQEDDNNDFVLFLDCPTNPNAIRDNREMIENANRISRILSSSYIIKCHPQDDPDNYKSTELYNGSFAKRGMSISDVLSNKSFGLLHASGVYLDLIAEGKKAFCYVNETDFPLVEDGMDSFKTVDELMKKIKEWNSYDYNKKKEYMKKITDYYLYPQNVEERYIKFVNCINSNQRWTSADGE